MPVRFWRDFGEGFALMWRGAWLGCLVVNGPGPITLDCGSRHAFNHGCIQRLARAVQAANRTPQLPVVPGPVLGRWSDGVDGVVILSWDGLDRGALSSIDGTHTGFARVRYIYIYSNHSLLI